MKKTIIQLQSLHLLDYQPNIQTFTFKVLFLQDADQHSFLEKIQIQNPAVITNSLIKKLKSYAKVEISEPTDFVGSLVVTEFLDEDKVESLLLQFFGRLCEKTRILKNTRDHTIYMKMYDQLRTEKLLL